MTYKDRRKTTGGTPARKIPPSQSITAGAHPPVQSNQKNPEIHLITTGAHPPVESNQKNPEIHLITTGTHQPVESNQKNTEIHLITTVAGVGVAYNTLLLAPTTAQGGAPTGSTVSRRHNPLWRSRGLQG
jgi:hypothetical protein